MRTTMRFSNVWVYAAVTIVASALQVAAETIVSYDFNTNDDPTSEALNTSSSAMTGAGWGDNGRSSAGNFYGRGVSITPVTSYVAFTITADGGSTLDLTQLTYDYYVQQVQSGSAFTFETRSSVDGFASAIPGTYSLNPSGTTSPYQHATLALSGDSYDGLTSIEFRLYATSGTAYNYNDIMRWDNIVVTGSVGGPDTTAPTWTATYPKADTATSDGFTARAAVDEPGTAYYVVVTDGASAPSAAQVKAGDNSGDSAALKSGSIALTAADTENTAAITGLSDSTAYDVYFVAEDDEATPNQQTTPVKQDVTTSTPDTTAPTWTTDYPKADTATSDGFTARAGIDEPGTAYYVVVVDGATAPTSAEAKAGTGSGGSGELASGSIALSAADTESTADVTGLSASTAYDVYFVAEDDEGTPNLQTSPQKLDISTTAALVTMALFEFTSGSASSSDADASTTASDITIGSGITGEAFANNQLEIGGDDTAPANSGGNIEAQLQNAVANDMYFTFTVTIPGGTVVNLTSLSLSYTADNPFHFGIGVFMDKTGFSYPSPNNSLYGFYTHSTVSKNIVIDLSGAAFQGLTGTTVDIRVYASDGSSSDTRQHEFDDIALQGTIVPNTTAPTVFRFQ
jgi:hypothetical protein